MLLRLRMRGEKVQSRKLGQAGSMIGGLHETQDMLNHCAEKDISSDIEGIPIQQIREAYERTACMSGQLTMPSLKMPSLAGQILLAEDDADTRELVSYVLARSNYRVMVAENSDGALLLARSNQFDLYMIDNWMPGGSGIDLYRKLRDLDSNTPVLFYSGAAHETDKQEAFSSGARGYLTKPADNEELIKEVSRLIAEARNGNPK
jgi:CheY-like chemotaxis protein